MHLGVLIGTTVSLVSAVSLGLDKKQLALKKGEGRDEPCLTQTSQPTVHLSSALLTPENKCTTADMVVSKDKNAAADYWGSSSSRRLAVFFSPLLARAHHHPVSHSRNVCCDG